MVITDEVQRPVHDEVGPMSPESLLLLTGLGAQHMWADHQVSQRTRLLAGEADHRDFVLADDERARQVMICVSRAATPEIVIDR